MALRYSTPSVPGEPASGIELAWPKSESFIALKKCASALFRLSRRLARRAHWRTESAPTSAVVAAKPVSTRRYMNRYAVPAARATLAASSIRKRLEAMLADPPVQRGPGQPELVRGAAHVPAVPLEAGEDGFPLHGLEVPSRRPRGPRPRLA